LKLSSYARVLPNNLDEVILFNTIDKSIVSIEKKYIDETEKTLRASLPEDYFHVLSDMGFFISDEEGEKIAANYYETDDRLIISVETGLACNLRCPYCYQGDEKNNSTISPEDITHLINYIKCVDEKIEYRDVVLKVLGGEPTIMWETAERIIKKVYNYCKEKSKPMHLMIDTNGVSMADIIDLKDYDTLLLTIPLVHKEIHDKTRFLRDGTGTYNSITSNLNDIHRINPDVTIVLRHNTDSENINTFKSFVQNLKEDLTFTPIIDLSYTTELGNNNYENTLSYEEFLKWKSNEAIRVLAENDFWIMQSPLMTYERCQYRSRYSLKIFSDGTVGSCAMDFFSEGRVHIRSLKEVMDYLEKRSLLIDSMTKKCIKCKSFFLCACSYMLPCIQSLGTTECRDDGYFNIILEDFIARYLECSAVGKDTLFAGFHQDFSIR